MTKSSTLAISPWLPLTLPVNGFLLNWLPKSTTSLQILSFSLLVAAADSAVIVLVLSVGLLLKHDRFSRQVNSSWISGCSVFNEPPCLLYFSFSSRFTTAFYLWNMVNNNTRTKLLICEDRLPHKLRLIGAQSLCGFVSW